THAQVGDAGGAAEEHTGGIRAMPLPSPAQA
ncbi:MAG: hypothetical protein JWP44_5180, partial [Mucilaginibacter sp.]|nr:hypothetical protein [Mucilaginibacter sp.]